MLLKWALPTEKFLFGWCGENKHSSTVSYLSPLRIARPTTTALYKGYSNLEFDNNMKQRNNLFESVSKFSHFLLPRFLSGTPQASCAGSDSGV